MNDVCLKKKESKFPTLDQFRLDKIYYNYFKANQSLLSNVYTVKTVGGEVETGGGKSKKKKISDERDPVSEDDDGDDLDDDFLDGLNDSDDSDDEDNSSDSCDDDGLIKKDPETINKLNSLTFLKNKDMRCKRLKDKETIFLKFNDTPIYEKTKIVESSTIPCCDYGYLINNFKLQGKVKNITINYGGGFVPEITKNTFVSTDSLDTKEKLYAHIVDFSGLYPSVIRTHNLCISTIAYNSNYPICVAGKLISPFNSKLISQIPVPIKFNDAYMIVLIFVIKSDVEKSVISKLLEMYASDRNTYKKLASKIEDKSSIEFIIYELKQLMEKLKGNSTYGLVGKPGNNPLFFPTFASAVTYLGRLSLITAFIFFKYYLTKLNLQDYNKRTVLYGDTDSLFFVATESEILGALKEFKNLECNKNILYMELEKTLEKAFFVNKKNYITKLKDNLNSVGNVYIKGVFKSSYSQPTRTFLPKFINLIFCEFLVQSPMYDSVREKLGKILTEFKSSDDDTFFNKILLKKNIEEYKNKSALHRQIEYANKTFNMDLLAGSLVRFCFFKKIFAYEIDSKIEQVKFKIEKFDPNEPDYKTDGSKKKTKKSLAQLNKELINLNNYRANICNKLIDYENIDQLKFLKKFKQCNMLIENLVRFEGVNLEIDKQRVFENDLKKLLGTIFQILDTYSIHLNKFNFSNLFNIEYEKVFDGKCFDYFNAKLKQIAEDKKSKQIVKNAKNDVEQIKNNLLEKSLKRKLNNINKPQYQKKSKFTPPLTQQSINSFFKKA